MDSGLPRTTPIERIIYVLHGYATLAVFYILIHVGWIISIKEKITLKNLKNKVIFNYYRLLNKIK